MNFQRSVNELFSFHFSGLFQKYTEFCSYRYELYDVFIKNNLTFFFHIYLNWDAKIGKKMRMGKGEIMRKKAYKTWTVLWTVVSFAMTWILVGNKETEKEVWTAVWTNKIYIKIKTCAFSMIKMNNPPRIFAFPRRIISFLKGKKMLSFYLFWEIPIFGLLTWFVLLLLQFDNYRFY